MFEKLLELQKNSYVPLTGFRTAAIAMTKDGKGFPGVNVENPSFRDGLCAEQNAIAAACAAGSPRRIRQRDDGDGRNDVHAEESQMSALSRSRKLQGLCARYCACAAHQAEKESAARRAARRAADSA